MTTATRAVLSHVGKIRANNQDSGYAGKRLFVVADGMGGHAGGDVASAIAIARIRSVDRDFESPDEAEYALEQALLAANQALADTVVEHPELTGMGTTVSALLRVDGRLALAHVGDSRIYRYRDRELVQITADHTFVQRLVDSGRITPEEAAVHPRRSVLMRVLGDVDQNPEIDTAIHDALPGDRWLICSDGLSGYVSDEKIATVLRQIRSPEDAAQRLLKESLDAGAPDNVTIVLYDVAEADDPPAEPVVVGSASQPLQYQSGLSKPSLRLPTLLLHPIKAVQPDPSHFEPESEEYLDELILEDRRRRRRRRITWGVSIALLAGALVAVTVGAYNWTQTRYYVGTDESGVVVIYQGVQQTVGPFPLSDVYERSTIDIDELPLYQQQQVENTVSADSLAEARAILSRLADARE